MKTIYDFSSLRQYYEDDKLSPHQIAEKIGCQWREVYTMLHRMNIPIRGRKEQSRLNMLRKYEPYLEDVRSLHAAGHSDPQIAEKLGIPFYTANKIRHLLNIPTLPLNSRKQEKNHNWKGGYKTAHGYIRVRATAHPYAASDGYVPLHRLVMEQHIGRYLLPNEQVHHRDGDKTNNVIENLELLSVHDHADKNRICRTCPLRKQVSKLRKQIRTFEQICQIQFKEAK